MNKLIKHIFVLLFISCIGCSAFAQSGYIQNENHPRGGRMQGEHLNRQGYYRPQQYRQQPFRQQPYVQPYRQLPGPGNNRAMGMPNQNAIRRVQVIKEHFLSSQLALTTEQSERFWPVYRRYQTELSQVRVLKRLNNSNAQANGAEQVRKDLEYDGQLVDIRKRYNEEFLKIMPPEKVSQLYKSERGFTDELIKNLNERNNQPPE